MVAIIGCLGVGSGCCGLEVVSGVWKVVHGPPRFERLHVQKGEGVGRAKAALVFCKIVGC